MRLQPIVVTLATMFIVQGGTLLILDKPGGMIPPALSAFFTGDVVPDVVPAAIVVLLVALESLGRHQAHASWHSDLCRRRRRGSGNDSR